VSFIVFFLSFHSITDKDSFAENNSNVKFLSSNNSVFNPDDNIISFTNTHTDNTPPSINITYPFYPPTIKPGKVLFEGIASDSESGIQNIYALAHSFPYYGNFTLRPVSQPSASPIPGNNWTLWSVPFNFKNAGAYRVVIVVTDNAGNANYAETTINIVPAQETLLKTEGGSSKPRIAFVRPTFTEAAYQEHGFYDFYSKYTTLPFGRNISTDVDMLTVKTPRSVSEFGGNDFRYLSNITSLIPINGTELHDSSYNYFPNPQRFWLPFINSVNKVVPSASVTIIRDEDVDDGHLFYNDKKTNAFDILLLFHNEYVTQPEYDNLRQFVKNGGSIVFLDSEVFRAQVNYNTHNRTVTLVDGHDWKFDGKVASRGDAQRWYNETKKWVGGNFLEVDANLTFTNIPFNYTHSEEQFVNNPNVIILADYGIKYPKDFMDVYLKKEKLPPQLQREEIPIDKIRVASYSLDYGKGKVIMLGLSGRQLAGDPEFMKFFESRILPKALCPKFEPC